MLFWVWGVLVLPRFSWALYEDQIGKFDWRQRFVGRLTDGAFDDIGRRFFGVTSEDVLFAVNAKTGNLVPIDRGDRDLFSPKRKGSNKSSTSSSVEVYRAYSDSWFRWIPICETTPLFVAWRQVMNAELSQLLVDNSEIFLLKGGRELQHWDGNSGTLKWSYVISLAHLPIHSPLIYKLPPKPGVTGGSDGMVMVVDGTEGAFVFDTTTGSLIWHTPLQAPKGQDGKWIWVHFDPEAPQSLSIIGGQRKSQLFFYKLNLKDGAVEARNVLNAPWFDGERCFLVKDQVTCLDPDNNLVLFVDVSKPETFSSGVLPGSQKDLSKLSIVGTSCHASGYFALRSSVDGQTRVFRLANGGKLTLVKELNTRLPVKCICRKSDMSDGRQLHPETFLLTATQATGDSDILTFLWFRVDADSLTEVTEWKTSLKPEDGSAVEWTGFCASLGVGVPKILSQATDDSLTLTQGGKEQWKREEALAGIVDISMFDLPLSETQANIEHEFESTDSNNILSMFHQRIRTQLNLLQKFALDWATEALEFITDLKELKHTGLSQGGVTENLKKLIEARAQHRKSDKKFERDYFNIRKLVVVVTKVGKIFGIDSSDGSLVWKLYQSSLEPFLVNGKDKIFLFPLRTTSHHPHEPMAAVLGKSLLCYFNPMNGKMATMETLANEPIVQATLTPHHDATGMHGVIIVGKSGKVTLHPHAPFSTYFHMWPAFYVMLVDESQGLLTGLKVGPVSKDSLGTEEVWQSKLPVSPTSTIGDVLMKRHTEHVHSQGRVLGDRSVLYKYLNPNLAAISVESNEDPSKKSITIYLVDAVTGSVVYSVVHKRASGPLHMVHSENWLVYTFWNQKARRSEMAVLELYEGTSQSDAREFSSLRPPLSPIVMRQAYVFPQGITALAATDTEKGITNRHILIAMPFGGVLQLPKNFLDPRRSVVLTPEMREEGVIPYIPELPTPTESIINYNQTLEKVRSIYTGPSGLESTSLVFIYGLDLFFTRVHPSGTFDVLKDDFDYWLIFLVLSGLIMVSFVTKKLARHRDLKQAWK